MLVGSIGKNCCPHSRRVEGVVCESLWLLGEREMRFLESPPKIKTSFFNKAKPPLLLVNTSAARVSGRDKIRDRLDTRFVCVLVGTLLEIRGAWGIGVRVYSL